MSATPAFVVVGGSLSQRTLVRAVRSRGLRVCVVDGSADALCFAEADVAVRASILDHDAIVAGLAEAGVKPVAVASMGSDLAVLPVARLAQEFSLPGLPAQIALNATDKARMRACFEQADVPCPPAREVASQDEAEAAREAMGSAIVLKPVDGSAQRGVSSVLPHEPLAEAWQRAHSASRSGRVFIERFIDGDEFTVNGFVVAGEYRLVTLTRRVLFPPPPLGVCLAHRFPAELSAQDHAAAVEAARHATSSLGIADGPSYAQLRIGPHGPELIEVGARLGGGKDAELGALVTAMNPVEALVDWALGRDPAVWLDEGPGRHPCGQVAFLVREAGHIERAQVPRPLPEGVHEAGLYFREGQQLPPLRSGADRLGYLIVTAPDLRSLDEQTAAAVQAMDIHISKPQLAQARD